MAATLRQVLVVTLILQVIGLEATVFPQITRCTCDLDAQTVTCSWERDRSDGNETTYTLSYWVYGSPVRECSNYRDNSCTFGPDVLFVSHTVILTRAEGGSNPSSSYPFNFTPYRRVKPNAPSLTATAEGSRNFTVRWQSSIPRVFRSSVLESGCQLQYRDSSNSTWGKPEDAGQQKSFTFRGLRPYTEYAVRVRCKAEYWGDYGPPVYVRTGQEAPQQGPKDVQAQTAPGGHGLKDVTISWEKIPLEHQNGPILHYQLNLTEGGDVIRSVSVDANITDYTFRGLTVGQEYQAVLWAVNAVGRSPTVTYDLAPEERREPITGPFRGETGATMVIVLGSALGVLLLFGLFIFFKRRAIANRCKVAKEHLWPRIPRPENFLAPPTYDETYQDVDHVHVPFVYLPPEPETVDDFEEERRKLLASLPDRSPEGASYVTETVGQGSSPVSTATGDAVPQGQYVGCHGSSEEVAGMPPVAKAIWMNVNKDAVPMATEGDNAQAALNYITVAMDGSGHYVAMPTGGTPAASSGDGTAGSQVMPNYVQVVDPQGCPVAMATEGDQTASSELAGVSSDAETTPREDGSAGSQVMQNYVQVDQVTMATEVANSVATPEAETPYRKGSQVTGEDDKAQPQAIPYVTMATEGVDGVSSVAAAREAVLQPGKVRRAGELTVCQGLNNYVQIQQGSSS